MNKIVKQLLLILALALCLPAAAQFTKEEEDLMRAYGVTEEYLEMQRKMQQFEDRQKESEQQQKYQRIIMLVLSLAVALVPVYAIGKMIVQHPEARTPKGVISALLIGISSGAGLFAFNYGWMYLRLKHGDALNFPFALLVTVGIAVGAFYLLSKKDKKDEKDS